MKFDMGVLDRASRYRILGSCITPRPIAWITSMSTDGHLNVAPFSFFNLLGDDPPVVAVGMVAHSEDRLKDTPANIRATGEFVIHLVDEGHAAAMNLTSADAPPSFNEAHLAQLELGESDRVSPPRIVTAPAAFECRVLHFIETGAHQIAILAEVVFAHVRDEYIAGERPIRIDVPAMNLIARLHGAGWYSRQTDTFELLRPKWSDVEPEADTK
ncbi:flavin reductase family protein [Sphingomonas populi]|uniref:Flavin reductase family protein n=1 Tax=Sphingomonas populi TaxID=2484750 RepID=A0A4Q6XUD0_9SPHN|nr:flavin reductase family protein [Sphingomonas populi]RZF63515.1 flavin reductase family protein [Sphingomonas populi]